jgi:hypothetical protein
MLIYLFTCINTNYWSIQSFTELLNNRYSHKHYKKLDRLVNDIYEIRIKFYNKLPTIHRIYFQRKLNKFKLAVSFHSLGVLN